VLLNAYYSQNYASIMWQGLYVTVGLEQPLAVQQTTSCGWSFTDATPWIQEPTKANYYQTILAPSAPVNILMELCWPSFSFTLRHWQLLSITDILLTVSATGITLLNTAQAHSQDFQKGGLWDPAWEWVREGGFPLQNGPGDIFTRRIPHTYILQ